MCERELETEQNCNILTLTLMAISVVSFSFSRASQPGAWGPSLSGTCSHPSIFSPTGLQTHWVSRGPLLPHGGFLYNILSLTHLISNSLLLNRGPGGHFCWVVAFSTASCHQRVSKLNRGSQRPLLPGGGFLYHILSLTHLISN